MSDKIRIFETKPSSVSYAKCVRVGSLVFLLLMWHKNMAVISLAGCYTVYWDAVAVLMASVI